MSYIQTGENNEAQDKMSAVTKHDSAEQMLEMVDRNRLNHLYSTRSLTIRMHTETMKIIIQVPRGASDDECQTDCMQQKMIRDANDSPTLTDKKWTSARFTQDKNCE